MSSEIHQNAGNHAAQLGQAGLNLRGLSAAVTGARFVIHLAFDSDEDRQLAIRTLQPTP